MNYSFFLLLACASASSPYPGEERDFRFDLRSGPTGRRPFVFVSGEDAARIRSRAKDPAYAREVDALRSAAEASMDLEAPTLERGWWEEARKKPWGEIYPEIYHHTCAVPYPAMMGALRLVRAHLAMGEERFREKARALFTAYLEYPFEAEHYDVGLNYAVWGIPALEVYDALHDVLSEGDRSRADRFFERFIRAELLNDRFWIENGIGGGINNHLAWHKKAIAAVGIFYDVPELCDFAAAGPRSARELLELGLRDQGVWAESSLPYHFTALWGLSDLLWLLRRHRIGPDPVKMRLADGRTARDLFAGISEVLFPDRTVPPLGDNYGRATRAPDAGPWALAHDLFGGDLFAWLLHEARDLTPERAWERLRFGVPGRPSAPPPMESRLFSEHGLVVLRSQEGEAFWKGEGFMAIANYGKAGVHNHLDRLSMMLYGNGRLLLGDREVVPAAEHSFSARIQRELNPETVCHSTVLIDWASQRPNPEKLDLIAFRSAPGGKYATIADRRGELYPGVRQMRSFCLNDAYVLDVFQVKCDAPRKIAWVLHPEGRGEELPGETVPAPASTPPWRWLGSPKRLSGMPLGFSYAGDFSIDLAPIDGAALYALDFPAKDPTPPPEAAGKDSGATAPPRQVLMVSVEGPSAVFAALYRIGRSPAQVRLKVSPPRDDLLRIDLEDLGAHHLVPALR